MYFKWPNYRGSCSETSVASLWLYMVPYVSTSLHVYFTVHIFRYHFSWTYGGFVAQFRACWNGLKICWILPCLRGKVDEASFFIHVVVSQRRPPNPFTPTYIFWHNVRRYERKRVPCLCFLVLAGLPFDLPTCFVFVQQPLDSPHLVSVLSLVLSRPAHSLRSLFFDFFRDSLRDCLLSLLLLLLALTVTRWLICLFLSRTAASSASVATQSTSSTLASIWSWCSSAYSITFIHHVQYRRRWKHRWRTMNRVALLIGTSHLRRVVRSVSFSAFVSRCEWSLSSAVDECPPIRLKVRPYFWFLSFVLSP